MLFFGVILSYFTRSYLKLFINGLQDLSSADTSEIASSNSTNLRLLESKVSSSSVGPLVLVIFLSLSIPILAIALYRNRGRLSDPTFTIRYGTLYANMKQSNFFSYQYICFFLLRRAIYALSIEYLGSSPGIQIYLQILLCMAQLCYTIQVRPFEEPLDQGIEVANEFVILTVLIFLLPYTNGSLTPEMGNSLGFFLLGTVLLCVLYNALFFIYASIKLIYMKIKRFLILRTLKSLKEEEEKARMHQEMNKDNLSDDLEIERDLEAQRKS